MSDLKTDSSYTLTKQQLQFYWETKFGEVWTSICESCKIIPIFPYSVFVLYEYFPIEHALVNTIQLCCRSCVTNRIYKTHNDLKRLHVWLAFFGPTYIEKCFSCQKNKLKYFDSWHVSHFIANAKGGSDKLDNLRPVCSQCNLTMKCLSIEEFQLRNHFKENTQIKLLKIEKESEVKNVMIANENLLPYPEHIELNVTDENSQETIFNSFEDEEDKIQLEVEAESKQLSLFLFEACVIEEYTENVEPKSKILKTDLVKVFEKYCYEQNIKVPKFSYTYYNHVFSTNCIEQSKSDVGYMFYRIALKPFYTRWLETQKISF
jgi:hypothetical protein